MHGSQQVRSCRGSPPLDHHRLLTLRFACVGGISEVASLSTSAATVHAAQRQPGRATGGQTSPGVSTSLNDDISFLHLLTARPSVRGDMVDMHRCDKLCVSRRGGHEMCFFCPGRMVRHAQKHPWDRQPTQKPRVVFCEGFSFCAAASECMQLSLHAAGRRLCTQCSALCCSSAARHRVVTVQADQRQLAALMFLAWKRCRHYL